MKHYGHDFNRRCNILLFTKIFNLFTEAPSLRPLIMWGPKLQFVWLIHKSGPLMKIHRRHCDIIVAGVISNAMQCNAMQCIQYHEHCVTYCAVFASENRRSLTENFARFGALWVFVEPNIRWQYEVLLWSSRPDVSKLVRFTRHVSVVLPGEHN